MKMAHDSYGAAGGVRVVQQFTRNREKVLGAYRLIMARLSPSQPERAQGRRFIARCESAPFSLRT